MAGKLYVVGTPIGNLSDFSPRAVETLEAVDFIAAEDTRVTMKILNHFGIRKPQVSYFEHNLREKGLQIIDRILAGENCAIVTDAGMPCISDPGEDLVRLCAENNIETVVVPGPSAVISALAVSGLVTSRFAFEGFLTVSSKKRRYAHLEKIKNDDRTLIFYEAPHKLRDTLDDLLKVFGDRKISLCRELTKLHEEVRRTTISEAIAYYKENNPKGEFVLVVEGAAEVEQEEQFTLEQAIEMAKQLRAEGLSAADAAKQAAKVTGFKKNDIYKGGL